MDHPNTFRAGDSVAWRVSLTDYPPAAGWSLTYRLLSAAGIAQNIVATPDGDDYSVSLSAAATADWPAGPAALVCLVAKGDERITLGAPLVTVLPNLAVAGNHDGRSAAEKGLADAEAALAAYVAAGQMHVDGYEVAGRKMQFRSVDDIRALITHYRLAVLKERAARAQANGDAPPGRVYYRG